MSTSGETLASRESPEIECDLPQLSPSERNVADCNFQPLLQISPRLSKAAHVVSDSAWTTRSFAYLGRILEGPPPPHLESSCASYDAMFSNTCQTCSATLPAAARSYHQHALGRDHTQQLVLTPHTCTALSWLVVLTIITLRAH